MPTDFVQSKLNLKIKLLFYYIQNLYNYKANNLLSPEIRTTMTLRKSSLLLYVLY